MLSTAFGLRFDIDQPIPELPIAAEDGSTADVAVRLDSHPAWIHRVREEPLPGDAWHSSPKDVDGKATWTIWRAAEGGLFRLIFLDGGEFLVDRRGSRVWAFRAAPLSDAEIAAYFLGPVMGFLLSLRGMVCLHSSAVAVHGKALAVAGPSGSGKSTLAGALMRRGLGVLADDIVALSRKSDRGEFLVPPGYPRLRLWPDSVRMLYGKSHTLPPMTPNYDKRYADLTGEGYSFHAEPLPLAAVYILQDREQSGAQLVEPLSGPEAFVALTANRYFPLPGKAPLAGAFDLLGKLAAQVPVRRVVPHSDPALLPRLCDLILDDFHELSSDRPSISPRSSTS